MSPVVFKVVGGMVALAGATAAGVGISHAYSGSSSDINPVSASNDEVSSTHSEKIKNKPLSSSRRWLNPSEDVLEWNAKVDEYKNGNKNDLKSYGFELKTDKKDKTESDLMAENVAGMSSACKAILDADFEDSLFDKAKKWCSVDKKIIWAEGQKDRRLLSFNENDSDKDKKEWERKLSDFKKNLEGNKKDFEVPDIQKDGGEEDGIKKLKKRCYAVGELKIESGKSRLFRSWCTVRKAQLPLGK